MALLVFPTDNLSPQLADLLKPSLRLDVADRVNQAILKRQGQSLEAKIKEWVRARAWGEHEARKHKKDVPSNLKLALDGSEDDGLDGSSDMDEAMNGDAMIS
jgi:hypothetical protein